MRASRKLGTLALAGVSLVLLSACGDGTVRPGAAAVVGNVRILDSQVSDVVTRGLKDKTAQANVGTDKPAFERQVLSTLILRQIVKVAAAKQGVTIDGADIDAYGAQINSQLQQSQTPTTLTAASLKAGVSSQDLRANLADFALQAKLGAKLVATLVIPDSVLMQAYQQNIGTYDQVDSAHILVATKPLADSILAQVKADPSRFAALAAKYSTDTGSKAAGGELGFQARASFVKPFADAIFTNKPGSYVEVHSQYGYHVIHVEARHTTTFEQAKPALRAQQLQAPEATAVSAYLQKTAKALGIHVNPRFGTWDAVNEDVVAATTCAATSFVSPSPRPATSSAPAADPSATPTCK